MSQRIFSIIPITVKISFFVLFALSGGAVPTVSGGILAYDPDQNTLSAHLDNIDMGDLARQLSRAAGIAVDLDESIRHRVSADFEAVPLEIGIKRLLGPLSSAFVFVKTAKNDKEIFRLETVRIFTPGNQLTARYERYEAGSPEGVNKRRIPASAKPQTPAGIRREISAARENLDILHEKYTAETGRLSRKIRDLEDQLHLARTEADRRPLVRSLSEARQEQTRIKNLNRRLILDEKRNYRELLEAKTRLEGKSSLIRRWRESRSRRMGPAGAPPEGADPED